jgi:thymidine kinase
LTCILIDEAQFLSKAQVYQLTQVVDHLRLPVLTYGLRTDFQGELFEGSQYLLAWAEELIEIKTICFCGSKATMNARIDKDGRALNQGAQIEIGGNERYMSLCRKHYNQAKGK